MGSDKLRINGKRLQSTLEEMAKIGGTPGGGVTRLALSDQVHNPRTGRPERVNRIFLMHADERVPGLALGEDGLGGFDS